MKQKSIRISGFTLVEMLVVIAILTLLVSMLLPAVNKVRESAYGVKCTGNLRQMALALETYSIDHAMVVPQDISFGVSPSDGRIWYEFLNGSYSSKIYIPWDKKTKRSSIMSCPKMNPNFPGIYGMNHPQGSNQEADFGTTQVGFISFKGFRLLKVSQPSDFILIADTASNILSSSVMADTGAAAWWTDRSSNSGNIWMAHPGHIANAAFADFHVEGCNAARLRAITNYNNTKSPTRHKGCAVWRESDMSYHSETLP